MADLSAWATPRLSQLLPLDEESLSQVIDYAASLSKEACADHLKNLLGDSPAALEFISSFNTRRDARQSPQTTPSQTTQSRDAPRTSGAKKGKKKAPLHSAGPPRRPDNYGNVGGGYMKAEEEDYMSSRRPNASLTPSQPSSSQSSRVPSPLPVSAPKPPPSANGPTISDMLPNVRSKTSKSSRQTGSGSNNKGTALTTNNISDLTAAIAALELSTNPTLEERRKCTCYASLHPLFDPAPNCMNCGKIICSLEGLQPCSFCGTPLLSAEEVQDMIRELRAERGQEKMRVHNEGVHHEGGPRPTSNAGSASPSKLDAAKAHRDKLLQFQAQNARRTKVVDETADFETPNVASTLWMSPVQRALALKKQQRIQREMEEKARPEWEKKKTVMSLDIKGGKVRRVYHNAAADSTPEASEPEPAEEAATELPRGEHAFSRNPLLAAGGLLRPVWKAPEGKKPEAVEQTERKSTWRRVQDDNDDNEQWILDGGVHGHTI
ncbi:hypothetical protein PENANT_c041G04094 [Penicillium antarcticum]|uniref:TRIP4/RQT4 C2HC5-type zinc finger domain-containing protein n=1 Tax=Penicillium antarcticum TaxID=416450 RepID=A0A1V6PTW7_9EURO|nr:uncharacterized protein N7508_004726 [Penicillium antarcticum]KAJ5305711.1 hypothetical protein N7508_004726 [Penicillium antarcticum]OQD79936.1 hypothetical protein PENANT_c041G04094 [Penicillium antarcticum]